MRVMKPPGLEGLICGALMGVGRCEDKGDLCMCNIYQILFIKKLQHQPFS